MRYILLIEDEPTFRNVLQSFLQSLGYVVIAADSKDDAMQYVHFAFDAVVFDCIDSGKVSTTAFIHSIRKSAANRNAKLLMITGLYRRTDDLDIDGVLLKPFNVNQLEQMLRELLSA